jgi:hypothetical protein
MMRFKFKFKKEQFARIMFNTPANSRVWIDGKYAFGREGGRMAPSFHRCPKNQYKDMKLHAGKHEILVGVTPVNGKKMIDWVIGIGDVESKQWMADIFWGGKLATGNKHAAVIAVMSFSVPAFMLSKQEMSDRTTSMIN